VPSIIPSPGSPGIDPNFTTTVTIREAYAVPAGTTYFTTSLELMYHRADYSQSGASLPWGSVLFVNNGTLWNRCLNGYVGTIIASQNFDYITNNGLMVAEAPTGQAHAINVYSTFQGLTNNGQIYAISYERGAITIQDWGYGDIVNNGLIAAQRIIAAPEPAHLVYKSFAIVRFNGGQVMNGESGSILSEGQMPAAIWLMRGHIRAPGQPEAADIHNAGLIETVSTDARYASTGLILLSAWHERMLVVNSGTIRAEVAIATDSYDPIPGLQGLKMVTNLAQGVIDGAIALTFCDEIIVNRGLIDGEIDAAAGNDLIDNSGTITGLVDLGAGADLYLGAGAAAAVRVLGGAGTDLLIGGGGADRLEGGDGNDWLQGGGGADLLIGGAGADRFVIAALGDSSAGAADTIQGFESGVDKIDLTAIAPVSVNLSTSAGVTTITANAAGGSAVVRVEGTVTLADLLLAANGSVLEGTANADTLSATGAIREIHGGDGDDLLSGSAGNDILDGGTGADIMRGGLGDDIYYVDNPLFENNNYVEAVTDRVIEFDGEGIDEVRVSVAYDLPDGVENLTFTGLGELRVEGNRLDNVMVGNAVYNIFAGGDGDDVLIGAGGGDSLEGGLGADRFVYHAVGDSIAGAFDTIFSFESGTDKIDLSALAVTSIGWTSSTDWLLSTTHMVTIETSGGPMTIAVRGPSLAMSDFVSFFEPDQQLTGTPGNDTLIGGTGNDTLNGLGGADWMIGKQGNDTYFVDNAGDVVEELANEGRDTVYSGVSYVLGADQHVEVISTSSHAATSAINLTGNILVNTLAGNAGANVLNGGGGADFMHGYAGNDIYYVDHALDKMFESAGAGTDMVYTSVSYTLAAGQHVENLSTISHGATNAINLTGNSFNNTLIGNAGANILNGGGGNDTLQGLGGNDTYYVDSADLVIEAAAGGSDVIYTSVSYALGAGVHVEALSTANTGATTAINLTGNSFNNHLVGNAGANILNGGGGNDTLQGLGGNDTYFINVASVQVLEGAGGGADLVYSSVSYTLGAAAQVETLSTVSHGAVNAINLTGNAFNNTIIGNAGANVLDGKGGNDTLQALGGADTFAFTTALGAGNVDLILNYSVADDTIWLDDAVFTGLGLGALNANAFVTGPAAADADDRIIYNSATGALLFDADGNGAGGAIQFASIGTGLSLTAGDFAVI